MDTLFGLNRAKDLHLDLEVVVFKPTEIYYPGNSIEGVILVTSNMNHTLSSLQLIWTGRIKVKPAEEEEYRVYFEECSNLMKAEEKQTPKKHLNGKKINIYPNVFDERGSAQEPVKIKLKKLKTVGFCFMVAVPVDKNLPSYIDPQPFGEITYSIGAYSDDGIKDNKFFAQKEVRVCERVDICIPRLLAAQCIEKKDTLECIYISMDHTGYLPGSTITILAEIMSNVHYYISQGITATIFKVIKSTVRTRCYESKYIKIHFSRGPLYTAVPNSPFLNGYSGIIKMDIPKNITPTIRKRNSSILDISYTVEIELKSSFSVKVVSLPLVIGTVSSTLRSSSSYTSLPVINRSIVSDSTIAVGVEPSNSIIMGRRPDLHQPTKTLIPVAKNVIISKSAEHPSSNSYSQVDTPRSPTKAKAKYRARHDIFINEDSDSSVEGGASIHQRFNTFSDSKSNIDSTSTLNVGGSVASGIVKPHQLGEQNSGSDDSDSEVSDTILGRLEQKKRAFNKKKGARSDQ